MGAASRTRIASNNAHTHVQWVGYGRAARVEPITITGPTSYDTGGSVLSLAGMGFTKIQMVIIGTGDQKYIARYIPTATTGAPATGLLFVFDTDGNAEATSTTDLDAVTWEALVIGF